MSKIVSEKDTKAVIYKAYQVVVKEKQALEKQLTQFQNAQAEADDSDEDYDDYNVESGDIATTSDVIDNIKNIQRSIAQAISTLSAEQVVEADKLQKIAQQIGDEKAEAKELYNIDLTENALEQLFNNFEQEKTTFEENFAAKKKAFAEILNGQQQAWNKEREEHDQKTADRNKEAQQSRKREQDEFDYLTKQTRAASDDEQAQKAKKLAEELAEARKASETTWAAAEKAIADKEEEAATYKTKFEAAEGDIQKEVKKAEAEGKSIIERDHKVKLSLYNSDVDADQRTIELRISSLNATIKTQAEQVNKLTAQLENALKQAQSLAIKALEGSSNADSFAAIREIAIEQAKNSSKNK
jgi:hypothetical protein